MELVYTKLHAIMMRKLILIILTLFLTSCKINQLAVIKHNNKFGCINRKGEIVIEPIWDYILQGNKNKQILVKGIGMLLEEGGEN